MRVSISLTQPERFVRKVVEWSQSIERIRTRHTSDKSTVARPPKPTHSTRSLATGSQSPCMRR